MGWRGKINLGSKVKVSLMTMHCSAPKFQNPGATSDEGICQAIVQEPIQSSTMYGNIPPTNVYKLPVQAKDFPP